MNIGIYLYYQSEVLDFAGPFEVFSTAARLCGPDGAFHVFLIGETGDAISARGNFGVNPHYGFHNHPALDVLIVVGGVHTGEMEKPQVINWIAEQSQRVQLVASVCTGAFLLAQAGVITYEKVTTHWEDIDGLRKQFPSLTVVDNVRWVDAGQVVTSGGISAGIDMSLHLVSRLHSRQLAEATAGQMEFEWTRVSQPTVENQ